MKVYYSDTKALSAQEKEFYFSYVPSETKARKSAYCIEAREESLLADGFSRYLLEKHTDSRYQKPTICYNENGKPLTNVHGLCFSVSHSDGMACVCIGDLPVGTDIEKIRNISSSLLKTLSYREKAYVKYPEDGWNRRFLQLWTLKEAWIKCRGGVLGDYGNIHFDIGKNTVSASKMGFHFTVLEAPKGYVGAVCEKIM